MTRPRPWLALVVLLGSPAAVGAQGKPFVRTVLQPRVVTVGQPVTLTVDVFVPTSFTSGPRFPQLEVKDAVVVFLETGGETLTESIAGGEWPGQRRSYVVYPQRPGDFDIPPFEIKVRYAIDAQPSPRTPVPVRGDHFTATIPEAARGLASFIATSSFQISATTDRPLEGLKVGDSVTRTIAVTATDAFAMMLPPLSFPPVDGLGVYPARPRLSDTSGERGETRAGKRVESVTYVLQKEGDYRLPAIDIDWWDTSARTVRRASVPEMTFRVAANPDLKAEIPLPDDPSRKPPPPDPWKPLREALRRYGPFALAAIAALAILYRLLHARFRALRDRHRARAREREESAAAYLERVRGVEGAGSAEVLAATYRFLDRRGEGTGGAARLDRFVEESGDPALPGLAAALVGSALAAPPGAPHGAPPGFVEALVRAARHAEATKPAPAALGPLNPR